MVRDGTDPDLDTFDAIQQRERKPAQRHQPAASRCGRAEARIFGDQARRALELVEECASYGEAGLVTVVRGGLVQFFLRFGAEGPAYASFARARANA